MDLLTVATRFSQEGLRFVERAYLSPTSQIYPSLPKSATYPETPLVFGETSTLERLLSPPISRPVWQRAWRGYQNKCIEWQLQRDEFINGPWTRANKHNQKTRLMGVPAEIRNTIWTLAIEPEYNLQKAALPDHYCVGIFDRAREVYPDASVLLISRDIYRETRLMYDHAVKQYWSQSFLHLEVTQYRNDASWEYYWARLMLPMDFSSLTDEKLKLVRRLQIARWWAREMPVEGDLATFKYSHGIWKGYWMTCNKGVETRFVVLYKQGWKMRARLREMLEGVRYKRLPRYWEYGPLAQNVTDYEALILPHSIDEALLQAVNAAAAGGDGMQTLTRKKLKAMWFMQWQTRGWYW